MRTARSVSRPSGSARSSTARWSSSRFRVQLRSAWPCPCPIMPLSRERWLDADYQAKYMLAHLSNQEFLGDTLPVAMPNLGPEIFAALRVSAAFWRVHLMDRPHPRRLVAADEVRFDPELLPGPVCTSSQRPFSRSGRGIFITGMTDWHPGGDWLAARAIQPPGGRPSPILMMLQILERAEKDYMRSMTCFTQLPRGGTAYHNLAPFNVRGPLLCALERLSYMISNAMFERFSCPG